MGEVSMKTDHIVKNVFKGTLFTFERGFATNILNARDDLTMVRYFWFNRDLVMN